MAKASWVDTVGCGLAKWRAGRSYLRFIRAAHDAVRVQRHVLFRNLTRNAESAFGRDHGFSTIRGYGDFALRVPVRDYEGLRPYVDRVVKGETQALFGPRERVLMFALTSGSTDRPKYVPVTPGFVRQYRRGWSAFGSKAIDDHPEAFRRPILQIVSPMDESRTPHGVPCGAISGLIAAAQHPGVRRFFVTPPGTAQIDDPDARNYAVMRLAVPRDVAWIATASPATPVRLARCAARHAERLIRDVHDGTLRPPADVPPGVLARLQGSLAPDRPCADRLANLASRHGELLPKHYWRLSFLANWMGGTLSLHLRDFPRFFGDAAVRDIGLLATEGRVTVPLADGTPEGVLDVEAAFFEFAEGDADSTHPEPLLLCHEVGVGREYRVVMTGPTGLYRYDLEDRVRVTGFVGQAPVLEFLHRGANVGSITGEKITEWQAIEAFRRASLELHGATWLFLLSPVWGEPPHYQLQLDADVPQALGLAERMDRALMQLNMEYASRRQSGRLNTIQLVRLPDGTLTRRDLQLQSRRGAANEQFKHQYLLTQPSDRLGLGRDDSTLSAASLPPHAIQERN